MHKIVQVHAKTCMGCKNASCIYVRQGLSCTVLCDARSHILDILKGLDFGCVTMSDTNQADEDRADEDRGDTN